MLIRGLSVAVLLLLAALIFLDAKVRYGLAEHQWQAPARVYARALQIVPGAPLYADELAEELRLLGYRFGDQWREPGTARREGARLWVSARAFDLAGRHYPAQRFQVQFGADRVQALFDASGQRLASVWLEPLSIGGIYTKQREDRLLLRLQEVPQSLIDILLLVEDRDFYQHRGISLKSIARALWANLRAGQAVQGGSTLTQQLVKNVFLSSERSLWRKGLEALMALLVEWHYSKQEILELYINEVYLGQEGSRAIHGFALAAQHYFNRPLTEISLAQQALLVGMIKGPSYYDPWRRAQRAKERRDLVLRLMVEAQLLAPLQAQDYRQQDLGLAKNSALEGVYPAYLDLLRRQLRRDYSAEALQTEGLSLYTRFDPLVQRYAEQSLSAVLGQMDEQLQAAMVISRVETGDVLAVVGARQMRYAGFNRALDAVRPVGSLIKPLVYLAALEQPQQYTLISPLSDAPVQVRGADQSLWQPANFDHQNHGEVPLHQALAQSYNQATARLGMQLGLDTVLDLIRRMGVQREQPAVPALLLGAGGMTPLDVATLYQTIASKGLYTPLRSISAVADSRGQLIARYPLRPQRVVAEPAMHLLHYALMEVMREGTGRAAYQRLGEDFKVAGKTGTTNDLRDSWFAGFAGDYLAVVWIGRDDNGAAGLTGSSGALKVWREFMARASRQPLDFSVPEGIDYHWVDDKQAALSGRFCAEARYMPFIAGSAPRRQQACDSSLPQIWRWFQRAFRFD